MVPTFRIHKVTSIASRTTNAGRRFRDEAPITPETSCKAGVAQSAIGVASKIACAKENPRLHVNRSLGFFVGSFLGIAVDSRIFPDESEQVLLHGFFRCCFGVFRKKLFSFL